MPVEVLQEYETKRLKYVRLWCQTIAISFTILHIIGYYRNKYQGDNWIRGLHYSMTGMALVGVLLSHFRNIRSIYWTIMLLQT